MRSRFFSIYFTITGAKKYRSLCMVQFDLLPSPPRQPPGHVHHFGAEGGELFDFAM